MDVSALLTEHFDRVHDLYPAVVDGLSPEAAHARPGGSGNSVVWLLWHAARVQDDHLAGVAGTEQAWPHWRERFGLPLDEWDTGYGHSDAEVDAVQVDDLQLLVDYQDAVHQLTLAYLAGLDAAGLDRVVDDRWDPPVTAGVRLVSVLGDCLQHLGQAAYVAGLPVDD